MGNMIMSYAPQIGGFAKFVAKWDINDWLRLPSNAEEIVWNSVDEINQYYGDIFVPSDHDTPTIRRIRDEVHLSIQVNFDHPDIIVNKNWKKACS